jgi:hypothetical protein
MLPHVDTTELGRDAEMLMIRAAALSTRSVSHRLDRFSSYRFGDCTRLLGATSLSTSAKKPQYRWTGHDEQGAVEVIAAEE